MRAQHDSRMNTTSIVNARWDWTLNIAKKMELGSTMKLKFP